MSLDTALDDASASLRDTPVPAPPAFDDVLTRHQRRRRRARLVVTVASVALVVVGAVAVLRTTEREVGVVAGDPPVTAEPAVPTIEGAGLDVIGGGAFRLTARPGALVGVTELIGTTDDIDVLGQRLRRVSDLTTADAAGNQYRVESFEATAAITPWLVGQLPAGTTPIPIGPSRVAALERSDPAASLTWAYDADRVVRVSVTSTDDVNPTQDLLARMAGSVLAADRLPRPDVGPPVEPPTDVTGLPYLAAEQVLLDQGHTVRIGVQITAGFQGPSTVVGVAPFDSGLRSVLVATARTSNAGVAPMLDTDGIPVEPAAGAFIAVAGEHGGAGFIHARDGGFDSPAGPAPPPGAGVGVLGSEVFPVVSMLPDGELAGTWEQGFVALDVLIDPDAEPTEINRDLVTTVTTEQRERDGAPVDSAPFDPPADDWVTVEQGGLQISVPPTWTVVEGGTTCPVGANTIVVGDPGGCPMPGTDVPWILLRPLPDDLAELGDFVDTCRTGAVNGSDSCRIETSTERMTFDGTDAFLEISYGNPRANLGDITNTIRVTAGPRNVQPIGIARSWVDAGYAGDCATRFELASDELRAGRTLEAFEADCRATLTTGSVTFVSAQMHAAGPGGGRATVVVARPDGTQIEHHLGLAHRFDPAIRGTRWSVAAEDAAP